MARPARLRPRELDCPDGRGARPSHGEYQRGRRRAGEGPAQPIAKGRGYLPLFVFDAGYEPVRVQQRLEDRRCQILVRLRAGRCFYADPSGPPAPTGRSRRHGRKLDCKDPSTWPEPSAEHACEDASYGTVRVRAWAGLHPKVQVHEGHGSRGPTPIVRGTLVLVEVERLPHGERRREPRVLWLWWHGPEEYAPNLSLLWRTYARRFDLEHTFRFLKQTLGWATPRVRHPEQADRWTWLVVAALTQLRLARGCVADRRLPWERRYARSRTADSVPGPTRRFGAFAAAGDTRETTETLRALSWSAQRAPFGPGKALPGPQKGHLNPGRLRTRTFCDG
jgi:hypothetical protein